MATANNKERNWFNENTLTLNCNKAYMSHKTYKSKKN